jgi:membrane protein DedA with SNARE-associated domain
LGQYLFLRHGAKVVFLGRLIAVLRIAAAFLAGVNRMHWRSFFLANAAGASYGPPSMGWERTASVPHYFMREGRLASGY